jgi:hypothetical protein
MGLGFQPYTVGSLFVIINSSGFLSHNYDSLVYVIIGSGYFQLDFSFIGFFYNLDCGL